MKKNLIIFMVPPEKIVNGGIMSIFSICKNSRKFTDLHKADVVLTSYPGVKSYGRNDLFENDETVYSFDDVIARGAPESLMLHVPEYASYDICKKLREEYADYLGAVKNLHVNIMNQNVLMMPAAADNANWFTLTPHVTQTIAHFKTATQAIANDYDLPTHLLTTFLDPDKFAVSGYEDKDKLICFSPDETDEKAAIVATLQKALPDYTFLTIQNMTYEAYKETVKKSRFTITFGEGFDSYFMETLLMGGVGMAVYNEDFFPDPTFADLKNTFASYQDMADNIVATIKALDNKKEYETVVAQNRKKIINLYNYDRYLKNMEAFYKGDYTYSPQAPSAEKLIGRVITHKEAQANGAIADRDKIIEQQNIVLQEKNNELAAKDALVRQKEDELTAMRNSRSWRVTRPLRKLRSKL